MKKLSTQTAIFVSLAFILGCNEFMIVGILTNIATDLNVSLIKVGSLVTIFAFIYALSTPVLTLAVGKRSKYYTLLTFFALFIIGNTLSAFATNFTVLLLSRIICALFAGAIISIAVAFSTILAPPEKRNAFIAWIFSGFSIASVLGVPLGTFLSTKINWRFSFLFITLCSLVVFWLLAISLPKWKDSVETSLHQQLQLMRDPQILLSCAMVLLGAGSVYVFYTYLEPLLSQILHFTHSQVSLMLLAYGVMTIFSNQFSGKIDQRGGIKKLPWIYLAEVLVFGGLWFFTHSISLTIVSLLLIGVLMYLPNSPLTILFLRVAEERHPQSIILASSLNSIFFNFGISLGSAIGGSIVSGFGIAFVGFGSALLALLAWFAALLLNQQQKTTL